MTADIISTAYRHRAASGDFAEWCAKNPELSTRLNEAMKNG